MKKINIIDLDEINKISKYAFFELQNCDIGEFFFEDYSADSLMINNNIIQKSRKTYQGFSLRKIINDITYFDAYDGFDLFYSKYSQKLNSLSSINTGILYPNSTNAPETKEQISFLKKINDTLRQNTIVKNVILKLEISQQDILIFNNLNRTVLDQRPLIRLVAILIVEKNGRTEECYSTYSIRDLYSNISCNFMIDDLFRQAEVSLISQPSPAGSYPVILGNAGCGVLLHEAIGHGMEADFNAKNISAFNNKIGKKICNENITIVDNGLLKNKRGSINYDDEGIESQNTYLVKNGILNTYLCDRYYGKKLGLNSTGSGRRQSYKHTPIPRMRNTYMLNGNKKIDNLISMINKGVYLSKLGGGQVDISSGDFSFNTAEAYWVENGQIQYPIKDCVISGNGPKVLEKIQEIGDDFELDNCGGTCGKDGQWVPVGVGQPSVLISDMIVGGSKL